MPVISGKSPLFSLFLTVSYGAWAYALAAKISGSVGGSAGEAVRVRAGGSRGETRCKYVHVRSFTAIPGLQGSHHGYPRLRPSNGYRRRKSLICFIVNISLTVSNG
jgi:hypothetical protein